MRNTITKLLGVAGLLLVTACGGQQNGGCPPGGDKGCKIAGCSRQLCIEEEEDGITTCEWREEYACYRTATCTRQNDGVCGWTLTNELRDCLRSAR